MQEPSLLRVFAQFFLEAANTLAHLRQVKLRFIENINYQVASLASSIIGYLETAPKESDVLLLPTPQQIYRLLRNFGHLIQRPSVSRLFGCAKQQQAISADKFCEYLHINKAYGAKKPTPIVLRAEQLQSFSSIVAQQIKFCEWVDQRRRLLQMKLIGHSSVDPKNDSTLDDEGLRKLLKNGRKTAQNLESVFEEIDFFQNSYVDSYALSQFVKYYTGVEVEPVSARLLLHMLAQQTTEPHSIDLSSFKQYFTTIPHPIAPQKQEQATSTDTINNKQLEHEKIQTEQSIKTPNDQLPVETPKLRHQRAVVKPSSQFRHLSSMNSNFNNSSQFSMNLTLTEQAQFSDIQTNNQNTVPPHQEQASVLPQTNKLDSLKPTPFVACSPMQRQPIGVSKLKRNNKNDSNKNVVLNKKPQNFSFQSLIDKCEIPKEPRCLIRESKSNYDMTRNIYLQRIHNRHAVATQGTLARHSGNRLQNKGQVHSRLIEQIKTRTYKYQTDQKSGSVETHSLFQVSETASALQRACRFKKQDEEVQSTQEKSNLQLLPRSRGPPVLDSFKQVHPRNQHYIGLRKSPQNTQHCLRKDSRNQNISQTRPAARRLAEQPSIQDIPMVLRMSEAEIKYEDYLGNKKIVKIKESIMARLQKLEKCLANREALIMDMCSRKEFNPLNAFNILDTHETGYLTYRDLFASLETLGIIIIEAQQKVIWQKTALQSRFSYQSFINLFRLPWILRIYQELIDRQPVTHQFKGIESWHIDLQFTFIQFMRKLFDNIVAVNTIKKSVRDQIAKLPQKEDLLELLFQLNGKGRMNKVEFTKVVASQRLFADIAEGGGQYVTEQGLRSYFL